MRAGAKVRVAGVSCAHGPIVAVRGVDVAVEAGEKVALIGTNGSGKTTLLRAILGLHTRTRGEIAVDGHVARSAADWARRRRECAWLPQRQSAGAFPLLGEELLDSSGAPAAARSAADQLGVGHLLRRPVSTFSGGQLQRTHLARAVGCVAAGARAVLADEPTAALDFQGRAEAAEALLALPVTVLVVTHDQTLAQRCDRRLEMAAGRLREVT
ncbi:ATP-binding cassette domain-containing protein [Salinactinospora qingdaonensis]|uniref:ABC transporter ATP-binding protein n=1 Tax=Salinactinospora qingdaonensis TaxID=702744 RepID=A0ABP7FU54_9ACTN